MAYEPTIWKDRAIERPRTFTLQNNPDGTVTLVPVPGVVAEAGTPVNAANLNKLEQGLKTHEENNVAHGNILGRVINTEYNVYQLMLQNYYDDKYSYKKGLFFDGFMDNNVVDVSNSNLTLDVVKRLICFSYGDIFNTDTYAFGDVGRFTSRRKIGQSFSISVQSTIVSATFNISATGSPTSYLRCSLYEVENGFPTTLIKRSDTRKRGTSLTTSWINETFAFDTSLNSGTYAVVLEKEDGTIDGSNYYRIRSAYASDKGDYVSLNSNDTWRIEDATQDLYYHISVTPSIPKGIYQSMEQIFHQEINSAFLYVTSKIVEECFVSAEISIYTDAENFVPMQLVGVTDLGNGYQEDKFKLNSSTVGNKVKVKIILNAPEQKKLEVNNYGCILGVV